MTIALGFVVLTDAAGPRSDVAEVAARPTPDIVLPLPSAVIVPQRVPAGALSPPTAAEKATPSQSAPKAKAEPPAIDPWLVERLRPLHTHWSFGYLLDEPERYRLQILVSRVVDDPAGAGQVVVQHGYRADAEYFYPASAIKTFLAVAALRKVQDLHAQYGEDIDLDTPLALCGLDAERCRTVRDVSNVRGETITVGNEIRKMQLVSSNVAFNRLYNFVGHREINERLHSLGFESVRIRHRLTEREIGSTVTTRTDLLLPRGRVVTIPQQKSDLVLLPTPATRLKVGKAHYDSEYRLIEHPADFSLKNYASLADHHRLLIGLVRPELPSAPALGLTEEHRAFMLKAMGQDPRHSQNPIFGGSQAAGPRHKVLLRGLRKVMPLSILRFYNKGGQAYGFEVENAYAENKRTGAAMFVTAVVYANPNGVINDSGYAYQGITGPFLEALGGALGNEVLFSWYD